jgi:hypothetical protein
MGGGDRRKMITCSHGMVMGSNSLLFASVRVHSGFRKMKLCTGFLSPSAGRPLPHTPPTWVTERLKTNSWLHPQNSNTTHTHTHTHTLSLSLSFSLCLLGKNPTHYFSGMLPIIALHVTCYGKLGNFGCVPRSLMLWHFCTADVHRLPIQGFALLFFYFLLFLFF